MIFPEDKNSGSSRSFQPPHLHLQQAFTNLQANCNDFFKDLPSSLQHHVSSFSHLKNQFDSAISNLQNQATHALKTHLPNNSTHLSSSRSPLWARISAQPSKTGTPSSSKSSMSKQEIVERLSAIPVYTLCNSNEDFVLLYGTSSNRSLCLLCFKKEDADSILHEMKSTDPSLSLSTRVVAVPLDQVYQIKADGVAFRFIPEASQVNNALQEMAKTGLTKPTFSGVPVFQSPSLVLKSQDIAYRPVFFRKEELEDLLRKSYANSKELNPNMLRPTEIQVGAFEEIMNGMKDSSCSKWDDVVFVPAGYDISVPTLKGDDKKV